MWWNLFLFRAEAGIRYIGVTGVQTCALPIFEYRLECMLYQGDSVVLECTIVGTHRGEFAGVPATGKQINLPAVFCIELSGDRKSVGEGKSVDLGGRRISNKKNIQCIYLLNTP